MKISHKQFMQQLTGARYMDETVWRQMQTERELWSMFAFDDNGAHYIDAGARNNCAAAVTKSPGYFEPEAWIVQ